LRSAHKDLESKLKEAKKKQKLVEDQLDEKNSKFIQEKADLVGKRSRESATLKSLQENVQHLQTYMRTAEQGWDPLNSDIMGKYPELKTKSVLCNPEWRLTLINFLFYRATWIRQDPTRTVSA
jgi:predicted  nucleic acid-binding Zn-ribbon protein